MAPGKKLLFESGDESDGGVELKINNEYAKRFEHNKKREEQHRLEEKYKRQQGNKEDVDETDSSSDESEDDDAILATVELDEQINQTLAAIRNKDPRRLDPNFTFYSPIDAPAAGEEAPKPKKEKAVFLQDYHRERLLQGDTGADDEEQDVPKTYAQEQDDLKKSFQDAIKGQLSEDDSDDDGFIKPKDGELERAKAELQEMKESGLHASRAGKIKATTEETDVKDAEKDAENFLSNFMESRSWVTHDKSNWQAFESDEGEDENEFDKWEEAYNMRFEDPEKSNQVLKTYSRNLAAAKSARREETTGRKRQRELERKRKDAEKQERREERARLRKLKIEEAESKLKQIKQAAGFSGKKLKDEDWMKFLDDAWDKDKWEGEMQKTFGDQYYAEEEGDSDDEDGGSSQKKKKIKKPKWDDDIDIKDLVADFEDEERPNITLSDLEANGDEAEAQDQDDEEDEDGPAAKRPKTSKERKRERLSSQKEARKERSKIEALVDNNMNLDNPDILASSSSRSKNKDVTRFAYLETWAESYGMTAADILMAPSDAALNEFVGLKKLAHYRPDDKKAKDKKRLGKKARLRQWRRDNFGVEAEKEGPKWLFGGEHGKEDEAEGDESYIVEGAKSKKRKRRSRKKVIEG